MLTLSPASVPIENDSRHIEQLKSTKANESQKFKHHGIYTSSRNRQSKNHHDHMIDLLTDISDFSGASKWWPRRPFAAANFVITTTMLLEAL